MLCPNQGQANGLVASKCLLQLLQLLNVCQLEDFDPPTQQCEVLAQRELRAHWLVQTHRGDGESGRRPVAKVRRDTERYGTEGGVGNNTSKWV